MPLEVCPILESDVEALTNLIFAAFQDDPVSKLMYPVPATPPLIAWTVEDILKSWAKILPYATCKSKTRRRIR